VPTKSGLMLGLGETLDEVRQVMQDLRAHDCDMLTLGQYLQPSLHHLPVERYVHPDEFEQLRESAEPWVSPTWPVARWCVPPITPMRRPPGCWRAEHATSERK
jgi:hypothetical protein